MLRFFSLALCLASCGGNWSDEDLLFSSALPRREALRASLPSGGAVVALEDTATHPGGLQTNEPSYAWAQTKRAASTLNTMLDSLLIFVDQVRVNAPSNRTVDSRTWGPFSDANNLGHEVQLVISRHGEKSFEWRIESRPAKGEFVRVLAGTYLFTEIVSQGSGTITVFVKDFREVLTVDALLKELEHIEMNYVVSQTSSEIDVSLMPQTASASVLGYHLKQYTDGSGQLRFSVTATGPEVQLLELDSSWKATGEGKSMGQVRAGTFADSTVTECWGADFGVVHYAESWPAGVTSGLASDCVTIDQL